MTRKWITKKFLCLVVVALMILLLVQPLRLVMFSLVLPTTWVDTDSLHLYRVINGQQNFRVDESRVIKHKFVDVVQVNLSRFDELVEGRRAAYATYHRQVDDLKRRPQRDSDVRKRLRTLSTFRPIMTPSEAASLLFALETFVHACDKARLDYFLTEASLMGAVRHHGLIPWDDDIDVAMSARQWREIRDVLGNIRGFELYAPGDSQWKFYMTSAKPFPDKPFKFPNLDIFFYEEDATHIWAVTKGLKHDLVFPKKDIFPLQLRPFEHLMVAVPCNLHLVVYRSHDKNECVTPEYVHKTNTNFYFGGKVSVHCRVLYDVYPFVFSSPSRTRGLVDEYLKVGVGLVHKVTLSTGCNTSKNTVTVTG